MGSNLFWLRFLGFPRSNKLKCENHYWFINIYYCNIISRRHSCSGVMFQVRPDNTGLLVNWLLLVVLQAPVVIQQCEHACERSYWLPKMLQLLRLMSRVTGRRSVQSNIIELEKSDYCFCPYWQEIFSILSVVFVQVSANNKKFELYTVCICMQLYYQLQWQLYLKHVETVES